MRTSMNVSRHFLKLISFTALALNNSCNIVPRRLYLRNNTGKPIRLMVDSTMITEPGTLLNTFKDSLDGKRINARHITISFGKGNWEKLAGENLEIVLQHTTIWIDGNITGYRLPKNQPIGNGILIPELIVEINKP